MDETVRAHIFEPFFTTKDVGRGTGLGLSIVYSIVEQSGGTIAFDTVPGRGTSFDIALPRVDAPVGAVAAEPAPRATPRGHDVILLVEDDEDVRDFAELVLRRAGYEVLVADDGAGAVVLAAQRPDIRLLVSDVVMPRMNGHELAVELRRRRPALKVLHMSGFPGITGAGRATAATPFLQKPFSAEELLRRVHATLAGEPS
jgi:CheY-like chemotaxis protein